MKVLNFCRSNMISMSISFLEVNAVAAIKCSVLGQVEAATLTVIETAVIAVNI